MELLERVRACLLNARLDGSFLIRREGSEIRLDLCWESYGRDILAALDAGGFAYRRTDKRGVLLITSP